MFASAVLSLFLAGSAAAVPFAAKTCSLASAKLVVPANQTQIVVPTVAPSYVALGVGVQNYTCSDAGKYVAVGAVADIFDISCLVGTPAFTQIDSNAYAFWTKMPAKASPCAVLPLIKNAGSLLGQHYFIANPNGVAGAVSPKWDFTSTGANKGNSKAFVIVAKAGGLPSPVEPTKNVDWLSLNGIAGDLASQVFRSDTRGGQPPASCTVGSPLISVKYTSKYWMYGGSIKK